MEDLAEATDERVASSEEQNACKLEERESFLLEKGLWSAMSGFELWRKRFREGNRWKRKMTNNTLASQQQHDQQLLPGILDEIALKVIIPKLPWRALQTLMCVSRVWKEAYESRQVYASRVDSHATERFDVTQRHFADFGGNRLVARSLRDDIRYVLPSIPRSDIRHLTHYIIRSLDGKIYAAGGKQIQHLFVFDLAGQKEWKACARMQEPKEGWTLGESWGTKMGEFQCRVKDGKVYVWGGVTYLEKAPWAKDGRCEVYDPIVDSWSDAEFDLRKCGDEIWDESFLEV